MAKNCSHRQPLKLIMDQSEVSALPAGSLWFSRYSILCYTCQILPSDYNKRHFYSAFKTPIPLVFISLSSPLQIFIVLHRQFCAIYVMKSMNHLQCYSRSHRMRSATGRNGFQRVFPIHGLRDFQEWYQTKPWNGCGVVMPAAS